MNAIEKTTRHAYDALGRRIWKYDPTAAAPNVYYTYNDQWQILCKYTADTTCRQWFTYGNTIDEVLSRSAHPIPIPVIQFYTHDHLYSPAALANYFGNAVLERYEYDAYGRVQVLSSEFSVLSSSQYANPFAFTGRQLDILDAGNLRHTHYRHRDYSPQLGRFMQHDPLGITDTVERSLNYLSIPNYLTPLFQYYDTLNIYQYGMNNSVSNKDSLGLVSDNYKICRDNCDDQALLCGLRGIAVCAITGIPTGGWGGLICAIAYAKACSDQQDSCTSYCDEMEKWNDSQLCVPVPPPFLPNPWPGPVPTPPTPPLPDFAFPIILPRPPTGPRPA